MRLGAKVCVGIVLAHLTMARMGAQATLPPISMPPPPEAESWTATVSGGLALTNGNRDTSTLNVGYELLYDPKERNRVKSDAFYLRGKTDGLSSADRLGFNARDEYKLKEGAFLFGQLQYVRDRFKQINYIWAPTGGLGYRLIEKPASTMSIDTGLGVIWEKNVGSPVKESIAVSVSQKLSYRFSQSATFTQSISALYKTNDLNNAFYAFNASVASSMTARTQLKVEVIDTYKNQVTRPTLVKNDVALIVALVYKR
jgi:putative salt-induced outer membrane protein